MASERSKRDTYWGNMLENRGYLFVYIYVWTYVRNLYFDLSDLCQYGGRPRPKLHKTESSGLAIITRIILEIELFIVLNSFASTVQNLKTYRSFISIRVRGRAKLMSYLSQL